MSDTSRCNKEIYEQGVHVFTTHTIPSAQIEEWVQKVAQDSGQPMDWHFYGGRAVVLALGDLDKVHAALQANKKMHDDFYRQALAGLKMQSYADEGLDGIWSHPAMERI